MRGDQAPAAMMTCSALILPAGISTPIARPRIVVRRVTREFSVRAPWRLASAWSARASAGASTAPSSGANIAPRHGAVAGKRSATSSASSQSHRSPAWRWCATASRSRSASDSSNARDAIPSRHNPMSMPVVSASAGARLS